MFRYLWSLQAPGKKANNNSYAKLYYATNVPALSKTENLCSYAPYLI